MGAGATLCKGSLCALRALPKGQKGLRPPSCQAAWAGKSEGRCRPRAGSPTRPHAKPTRERSRGQEESQHPQDCKRDLSGDATPLHSESAGGTAQLSGPISDCNSFPKGNAFSSPVQTGTDTQAVLAAPVSAVVPAWRCAVPARGESALPAAAQLFTARTPAWCGPQRLETPGSCGGTARHPPATSTQEESL